jgi:resuscitation-promoting factor RpfB
LKVQHLITDLVVGSIERMRLYHSRFKVKGRLGAHSLLVLGLLVFAFGLVGCAAPQTPQAEVTVFLSVDGRQLEISASRGSSVQQVLTAAGVSLGPLDRSEPPLYGVIQENAALKVIRVQEEFDVVEVTVPFQNQVVRNESMPDGETRLVQPGMNGLHEVTYRKVLEDGVNISNSPVKTVVIREAQPEIVMVGSQLPFTSFAIPGRLVYLLGGNAWMIEENTSSRRPVITTGDLDGRIFSLSDDGRWLLFTRSASDENINSLWAAFLDEDSQGEIKIFDLNVANVVHFADWKPGSTYTIAYSTVEPRASAPGWQANNDLNLISLNSSGQAASQKVELETNMGGTYGWWGMNFAWSPDGQKLAYARPDSVGLLELGKGNLEPVIEIIPLQTRSDWAWVPGIEWSPDSKVLYSVEHVFGQGAVSPEESPFFDLAAAPLVGAPKVSLVSLSGMFSYPLASPVQPGPVGEKAFEVAYLQAVFPTQSESSRYYVALMDRDGSNRRTLFPSDGAPGLVPQQKWGAWSPEPLPDSGSLALAVIYQDNLWLIDTVNGTTRQITGDDLITRVDWK